jgi:hypothetical protein
MNNKSSYNSMASAGCLSFVLIALLSWMDSRYYFLVAVLAYALYFAVNKYTDSHFTDLFPIAATFIMPIIVGFYFPLWFALNIFGLWAIIAWPYAPDEVCDISQMRRNFGSLFGIVGITLIAITLIWGFIAHFFR